MAGAGAAGRGCARKTAAGERGSSSCGRRCYLQPPRVVQRKDGKSRRGWRLTRRAEHDEVISLVPLAGCADPPPEEAFTWWSLTFKSSAISCNATQYENDGRCCSLCKPGQSLNKDCTESSETECLNCADGEYQNTWNRETSCLLHRYCDEDFGFHKISEGTAVRNVNCSCKEGRHCSDPACETCVLNTACGPGHGVTQRASRDLDTRCSPCAKGTFSNITSDMEPCKLWSICSETQHVVRLGNSTTDLVCGTRPAEHTWVYVVIVLVIVACFIAVLIFVVKRRCWKGKYQLKEEHPPKENGEPLCHIPKQDNFPVEDQDITMQGLPVAQEQGKDSHMPQEEVREHLLDV